MRWKSYTPTRVCDVTSRLVSSFTSRAMPPSGVSPASMKPVISAYIFPGQAALRASRIFPWYSTIAANTGVGLFQCVQSQAGHRRRSLGPPSSGCTMSWSGVAQVGQNLKGEFIGAALSRIQLARLPSHNRLKEGATSMATYLELKAQAEQLLAQ